MQLPTSRDIDHRLVGSSVLFREAWGGRFLPRADTGITGDGMNESSRT
ncbi:hypothetical protein [Duganella vulcania]|nr:hypothetical protein [Duganella vulcania]